MLDSRLSYLFRIMIGYLSQVPWDTGPDVPGVEGTFFFLRDGCCDASSMAVNASLTDGVTSGIPHLASSLQDATSLKVQAELPPVAQRWQVVQ
jgi:hypothetical protein